MMTQEQVIEKLAGVFRHLGYDGASMSEFTRATGLGRSSLYHHFPEGKGQMAVAVVRSICAALDHDLRALAADGRLEPAEKVRLLRERLLDFYQGGASPCILDAMSFALENREHQEGIRQTVLTVHAGITALLIALGQRPESAQAKAWEALIAVQGSLVLSRAMKDPGFFQRCIAQTGEDWIP